MRYDFICKKCGVGTTVNIPMKDYDKISKVCQDTPGFGNPMCGGELETDWRQRATQAFILLGGGWTPKG
jgi:hypothetical protein